MPQPLHKFIREHMESILVEWEKFAKSLPPGSDLNVSGLRDDAQEILETIAKDMSEPQSREEQERKSKGMEESSKALEFAKKHASKRLEEGFDFGQIVSEYRALRASVIRLWTDKMESADRDTLYQLTRFNEEIDQALTYAIRQYSDQVRATRDDYQREVQESKERYRSLAELSPDAILVNLDDCYVYANPAAGVLLGAEHEQEILGHSPFDLLRPECHDMVREQLRRVREEGKIIPRTEYTWKRLDDSTVEVEVSAGPVKWYGKPATHIVARDISQRKRAEEMLREADQRKDEFLATLAHELRNPLAPIQTGIEIMRLAEEDPAVTKNSLAMMARQMDHLVRLVDDLLDISRISQGKVTMRLERVDVSRAIRKALEAASTSLHADERQVFINLPLAPLIVNADPTRLVQIVGNLLSNASKHTEKQGRIWITASREGEQAKISVRDDGVGIAPDMLERLFEMFMQVDPDRRNGLGIGLALVRRLAELHGGTVEARSEGLGKGSEFIVSLPLSAEELPGFSDEEVINTARLNGKRVLIVDDNIDAAASLETLLDLLGAEVHAVNDGPSALVLLEEFQPDLVLLDIGMPGMDGYEVVRRIRAKGVKMRVVAVTGWGQEEDRQRTLQAGFDDHLVKPIDMKDIERVVAVLN